MREDLIKTMYKDGIPETKYKILSWSGGIQSTTLAVMSAFGDLPPVDLLIYSDIGNEWNVVTEIMNTYREWFESKGMTVKTVRPEKNILDEIDEEIYIPAWTESGGPLSRACVWRYKLRPIRWYLREYAGFHPTKAPHPKANTFEMWLGMTTEEMRRTFPSLKKYIFHRYHLIEQNMSRNDCFDYIRDKGLPIPPKTSCVICPYRRAIEWAQIRDTSPKQWQQAIEIDHKIRHAMEGRRKGSNKIYLWKGKKPLDEVDLEARAKTERDYDKIHREGLE